MWRRLRATVEDVWGGRLHSVLAVDGVNALCFALRQGPDDAQDDDVEHDRSTVDGDYTTIKLDQHTLLVEPVTVVCWMTTVDSSCSTSSCASSGLWRDAKHSALTPSTASTGCNQPVQTSPTVARKRKRYGAVFTCEFRLEMKRRLRATVRDVWAGWLHPVLAVGGRQCAVFRVAPGTRRRAG